MFAINGIKLDKKYTVGEFVEEKGVEVGQILLLENGEHIVIGNATPYLEPTTNDGGIGWTYDNEIGKLVIKEILQISGFNILKGIEE